jgi:hypothetical protein
VPSVVDDGDRGALRRDRDDRLHRLGADRAVRMPYVRGVDRTDLSGSQRRHPVIIASLGRSWQKPLLPVAQALTADQSSVVR